MAAGLCLAFLVVVPGATEATAKPARRTPDPTRIEHPDKIGIGTYPVMGSATMIADLHRIGARWFYAWGPTAPQAIETRGWKLSLGEPPGGGGSATASGRTRGPARRGEGIPPVAPVRAAGLTLQLAASGGASGIVCLDYLASDGAVLGSDVRSLQASETKHALVVALPAATAGVRLSAAWRKGGAIDLEAAAVEWQGGSVSALPGLEQIRRSADPPRSVPFVPMIWSARDAPALAAGRTAPSEMLLAFNEPDNRDQADMSVEQALALWPDLMATGRRLSSPAVTMGSTLGPRSWLGRFMAEAERRRYRVDVIAVHYYPSSPSIRAFRTFLERVHAAYRRPIWITEWALADWSNPGRFSPRQQRAFFEAAVQMLDDLPYVERHAWFGAYPGLDAWDIGSGLIGTDGRLTTVGEAFRAAAGPVSAWDGNCDLRRLAEPRPMSRSAG